MTMHPPCLLPTPTSEEKFLQVPICTPSHLYLLTSLCTQDDSLLPIFSHHHEFQVFSHLSHRKECTFACHLLGVMWVPLGAKNLDTCSLIYVKGDIILPLHLFVKNTEK